MNILALNRLVPLLAAWCPGALLLAPCAPALVSLQIRWGTAHVG